MSDGIRGITAKLTYLYEGPYSINRIVHNAAYELRDEQGKIRGEFNKKQLKPYKELTGI